jgi:MtfA peptidase
VRPPWRRRAPAELPDEWRRIVARRLASWSRLDTAERTDVEDLVGALVTGKRWEAARGFELTDEVRVTIAAHAAQLLLGDGFHLDGYRKVTSIVVHASTIVVRGEHAAHVPGVMSDDDTWLDGQAEDRGPIHLAWDAVVHDVRHPRRGRNVVVHEFAHVLDMLDGVVDGAPPLDRRDRPRWDDVWHDELDRQREHPDEALFDEYAAESPAELFAVASEAFFTIGDVVRAERHELYGLLAAYYRQDPAARFDA